MKKFSVHVLLVIVTVGLVSSCYDRGIVDEKDFDHSLPNVGGLAYTKRGSTVKTNWDFPADIAAAFRRLLEVSIQKADDEIYRDVVIAGGEGTQAAIERMSTRLNSIN